jgi:hypothetical protein
MVEETHGFPFLIHSSTGLNYSVIITPEQNEKNMKSIENMRTAVLFLFKSLKDINTIIMESGLD